MSTKTPPDFLRGELQLDGVPDGALRPVALRAIEAISTPYEAEIDVEVDAPVDPGTFLRKGAQLTLLDGDGKPLRRFEGVVGRVVERWGGARAELTLAVVSPLASLGLSSDSRIFQGLTAPEIVKKVLVACGVPADRCDPRLTSSYVTRASCTQYGETMLAFVSRLLEEEGIFYFFEASAGGLKLVLGDAPNAATKVALDEVRFTPDAGLLGMRAVTSIGTRSRVRPGKVTVRDLDHTRPSLSLEASASDDASKIELYDHPGGYSEPAEGRRRAQNRLASLAAAADVAYGKSSVPELAAGHAFTLKKTWDEELDGEWLVTRIEHAWAAKGNLGRYSGSFEAIPKARPFRPLLRTPRPRIAGPQTAIVTGPAGREIHTNEEGSVKLKFPWDRHAKFDDTSSAWARVAQVDLTGSIAIPRVGWEVLVEFEHGDPDRPVVVGRLFNGTYVPPYPLPANKTRSTFATYTSPNGAGHNELRFEDAADKEHIHVHAQRDLTVDAANDRQTHVTTSSMTTVKVDQTIAIKGTSTVTVGGMCDETVAGTQTLKVTKDRTKLVKKDEKVTVVGDRSLTVTGSHEISTDALDSFSCRGDVVVKVGGNLEEEAKEAIRVAVGGDASLTVGGVCTELAKTGKTSTVFGKRTVLVGGLASVTSSADMALQVGGKKSATIGAGWIATAAGDIALSSSGAMEIKVGGAMALTAASGVVFVVGSSKVMIGMGGVIIDSPKIKITSSGPAAEAAALVGSK